MADPKTAKTPTAKTHETAEQGDPRDPYATGDAARPGSATMVDDERADGPASNDVEDTGRTDLSGFDVELPPDARAPGTHNPGLSDENAADGWREYDSDTEWAGDSPYPDVPEDDDAETEPSSARVEEGADLMQTATTLLEEDATLDIEDLSIELRGQTLILRGSAATEDDRERAEAIVSALPGIANVDNELEVVSA
ncbi:MAG: BON domain-containing protein [Cereibacter changlensis]